MTRSDPAKRALVNRLDPDGKLRDLIDVALRRYHQRMDAADGAPPPTNERPSR
jgi:hypothetical protein